jgi:uncharacterized protein
MKSELYSPLPAKERLTQIDAIRGLALLGVLLINVDVFSGAFWAMEAGRPYPMGWGGQILSWLRHSLVEGKAVALFSILFGTGLMIQMERSRTQNRSFTSFALRRLAGLAVFGLAHSFLLWNGDILLDYALLGLWVLPFLRVRSSRLLWSIPLLFVLALLVGLSVQPLLAGLDQRSGWLYEQGMQHYGQGSWLEALKFRGWEMIHVVGPLRLGNRLIFCVPFFILGIYFWKKGFFAWPEQHRRQLRRLLLICTPLGLAANLLPQEWFIGLVNGLPVRPLRVVIKMVYFFSQPALALGYLAGLLLLWRFLSWRKLLAFFAPLGRTALSQYLLQSLVCSLVFCGFGLGLYGKLSLSACIVGSVALFAGQAWLSGFWLRYFRMGPMEWLWRSLSYRRRPPFRQPRPAFPTLHSLGES